MKSGLVSAANTKYAISSVFCPDYVARDSVLVADIRTVMLLTANNPRGGKASLNTMMVGKT